jgi:serine/threonine protein kinase
MTEETLFAAALEKRTPAERAAFLDEACTGDAALRQRVEALLRSHEQADFLKTPAVQRAAEAVAGAAIAYPTEALTREGFSSQASLDFLTPSDKPDALGRLGHYEILEITGRGGMGIVLRAFDEELRRIVAIKVMAAQLATNATARQRFRREAQAAAAVSHDHVVTIHAVEEAYGLPYFVMQYVSGVSLQERLDRDGPLQLHEILRIGMQVAFGLFAAHAQGLIHRDIKPANILLENGVERVKITDFGLARAAADASLTHSGAVAGTPQYMSPEQARGEAIDQRSDLFSLGSVLYALCTGRAPFQASDAMAVLKRVCEETAAPIRESNPEVPDWLVAIIGKLHAKDPAQRYQSAVEVAELLGRYLAYVQHPSLPSLPTGVTAPESTPLVGDRTPSPDSRHPVRGHRRWAVAAVVLALLFGGLSLTEATGVTNLHGTVIRVLTGEGTLVVAVNDPAVKVSIEGDGGLVITGAGPHEVRLRPGSYRLQAAKDGKPVRLNQELVTITRGDKQVVRVAVEPKQLADPAHAALVTPWIDSDDWVVKGQEVHQLDGSFTGHLILFGDPDWTDYDFEAEVEFAGEASGEIGLIFRATELNTRLNICLGSFGNTCHAMISRNKGGAAAIAHVAGKVIKGRWYHVRVQARGSKFTVFLDRERLLAADSEEYPRGCVGLITNGASARFRNLKVTDPGGMVKLEGVRDVFPKLKHFRPPRGNG